MASSNDKLSSDAKRAGSRSFGGYLVDRALGRADFDNKPSASPASAAPRVVGGSNPANAAALEAAGMKKGGRVISKLRGVPEKSVPGAKNAYKAGGMVRRGYGKARGA